MPIWLRFAVTTAVALAFPAETGVNVGDVQATNQSDFCYTQRLLTRGESFFRGDAGSRCNLHSANRLCIY